MTRARSALVPVIALGFSLAMLAADRLSAGGPYTDDLSKCLVASTTQDDRALLVQWIFSMAALHPAVKSMANLSDADRDELNRRVAGMMQGLLTSSCVAETKKALKYEGTSTIEASFTVLGQVAGRELFADPSVAGGLSGLTKHFDEKKLKGLLQDDK